MNSQGKAAIVFGIFLVAIVVHYYAVIVPKNIRIQNNHLVICADILKYEQSYKVRDMTFRFSYNGREFVFTNQNTSRFVVQGYKNGKTNVMIVFEKDNPNNWRMLGDDEDFTYYNIKSEDTLGLKCSFY